jgi:hypothetical protein
MFSVFAMTVSGSLMPLGVFQEEAGKSLCQADGGRNAACCEDE